MSAGSGLPGGGGASGERGVEVGDEVFGAFEADGEAHEAVGDAAGVAFGGGHGGVRHGAGVGEDAFDAAEADRDEGEFDALHHGDGGRAVGQLEGEDGAAA